MPNFERSVRAPTHPDEWIEFWGAIYLANPVLAKRGVLFETFLRAPREILGTLGVRPDMVRSQISAWLSELERCLDADRSGTRCSNGVWISKMRRHRQPYGTARLLSIGK